MSKRATINRKEYEAREVEDLVVYHGLTAKQAACEIDRRYPASTQAAQRELQARGFDATDYRIEAYAEKRKHAGRPLQIVGKARLWNRQDLDDLAAELEADRHLTREVLWRERCKVTWVEERQIQEAERRRREKDLARRIGVSMLELRAAFTWGLAEDARLWPATWRKVESPADILGPLSEYWTEAQVQKAGKCINRYRRDAAFGQEVERQRRIESRRKKYRRLPAGGRKSRKAARTRKGTTGATKKRKPK